MDVCRSKEVPGRLGRPKTTAKVSCANPKNKASDLGGNQKKVFALFGHCCFSKNLP